MSTSKTAQANFDVLRQWFSTLDDKTASQDTQGHKTTAADPTAAKDAGVKESKDIAKENAPGLHVDTVPAAGGKAEATPSLSEKDIKKDVGVKAPAIKTTKDAKGACTKCGSKDCLGACGDLSKQAEQLRVSNLGNAVLNILKEASQNPSTAVTAPGMEKSAELTAIEKEAEAVGHEASQWYMMGRLQRMQDEQAVAAGLTGVDPALIEKLGGISGLLDKVAEADPTAPVPPEILAADGIDPTGGAPAPAAPEGMPGAEAGAGDDGAVMDQISQVLAENNISPEELDQMLQQISAARDAGASDEEIMQALMQLADEAGGQGGAPEAAGGAAAAETPGMPEAGAGSPGEAGESAAEQKKEDETGKEAALQKEAAERVSVLVDFFKGVK